MTDFSKIQNLEREDIDLQDYIDMGNPEVFKKNTAGNKHQNIMDEIIHLAAFSAEGFNKSIFNRIEADVFRLFEGSYSGYRACNTMYHDLEHTQAVVLSTARMIYGAVVAQGHCFSSREIITVLAAAFFHDIGFIQVESDTEGTGAKYTVGHELRSIEFIKKYLAAHSFTPENIEDCKHMIMATVLNGKFANIPFRVQQIELLAKIVGAADLMAQVADRLYLEKLLLLYREFVEAGIVEFKSEFDLLEKTNDFYEFVYLRRMQVEFADTSTFMRSYFKHRWNINRDLYEESILKNLEYLKLILNIDAKDRKFCLAKLLRNEDIMKKIMQRNN